MLFFLSAEHWPLGSCFGLFPFVRGEKRKCSSNSPGEKRSKRAQQPQGTREEKRMSSFFSFLCSMVQRRAEVWISEIFSSSFFFPRCRRSSIHLSKKPSHHDAGPRWCRPDGGTPRRSSLLSQKASTSLKREEEDKRQEQRRGRDVHGRGWRGSIEEQL